MSIYKASNIIKQSFPLLTICIGIEIMSGQLLNMNKEQFLNIPLLLALIPIINGMGGNIGSILGARLASGLHVGYITPDLKGEELKKNAIDTIILGVITFTFLAFFIYLISPIIGLDTSEMTLFKLFGIMLGAGIILIVVVILLGISVAIYSFKKGVDPDNVVTPIITTSCDALGIICLLFMVWLIL